MIARGWSPILGFLCLTGCVVEVHSGPTRHESREFERKGIERLRMELHMGAGEVKVRGDATQLLMPTSLITWMPGNPRSVTTPWAAPAI